MMNSEGFPLEVERIYEQLKRAAAEGGYHLNPDKEFTLRLIEGLLKNEKRFGYRACPCRIARGEKSKDIDIICPCYYRDSDLEEFGACYCGLYVSEDWIEGKIAHKSIPERRPAKFAIEGYSEPAPAEQQGKTPDHLPYPVWRCQVCGYLCARPEPPGKCPVCKATKDRFERFI